MAAIIAGAVKGIIQSNNVVVGVRIRPPNAKEIEAEMESRFTPSDDALNVQELNEDGNICKNWSYDYVFGSDCSNQYIFQSVGVNNKYSAGIQKFAKAFAIVIPVGFIFIALFHHFNH